MQFSNNLSENAIRPFTVGRRNWLFSDTPKFALAIAIKRDAEGFHGIDGNSYIQDTQRTN